ncbi:MAG: hypothetical protein KGS00_06185 [Alphaproteobacteria bacterium]|nr:hypothetical protein [Alphaproteobacteria bacterium]
MVRFCLAALLGAVVSLSWVASAQAPPAAEDDLTPQQTEALDERLKTLMEAATNGPFEFLEGPIVLNLPEDERGVLEFSVEADRTYALAGVCDFDCFEIDFEVTDIDGYTIGGWEMEALDDRMPIAIVTAEQSATRLLHVDMRRCASTSCAVAVVLFVEGS